MNRPRLILPGWLPAMALFCCLPVLADTVYRTVDANGVVRYTDTPPAGDAAVEAVEIDDPVAAPGDAMQQRVHAMQEIADRLAADRMAREKHRAELQLLQAQMQAREAPRHEPDSTPVHSGFAWGYPGYYTYPAWPYPKHGPWHPGYPPAGPPVRPPAQGHRPHARYPDNDRPAARIHRHSRPRAALQNLGDRQ